MSESNVHQQVISGNSTELGTLPARLNIESGYETCSTPLPFSIQFPIQESISSNSMFLAGMEFFLHPAMVYASSQKQNQLMSEAHTVGFYCLSTVLSNRLPGNDLKVTFVIREAD